MCQACHCGPLPAGYESITDNPPKRDSRLRLLMQDDTTKEAAMVGGVIVDNDQQPIDRATIKGWRRRA